MPVPRPGARTTLIAVAVAVLSLSAFLVPAGSASAASPTVTVSPATGPYSNGETIMISGSNFPSISSDPSGLTIIECSDPSNNPSLLPTDDSGCDASTANPLPIDQNGSGSFGPVAYQITALSTTSGGAINCGDSAATECVLWVGEDYVNDFDSGEAFSTPAFMVSSPVTTTPEAPLAIALPMVALLAGAGFVVLRRRRRLTAS